MVPAAFFARPAHLVGRDLIGRYLLVRSDVEVTRALILETEAYGGPDDPASHAAFRGGGRAKIMWEAPGSIYVYAAYGMYPCLNIVTGEEGEAGAVLIRGIILEGETSPVIGPGRVARTLGVSLDDQGLRCGGNRFAVSANRVAMEIEETVRIGITRGIDIPWRFVVRPESG